MKYYKRRRIILLIILLVLVALLTTLLFLSFSKPKNKKFVEKPIKLNFESRIEKLDTFDSGKYYKLGWLQVQGTHIDLPILDFSSSNMHDSINYSYGWLSAYYNDGETRDVIVGHNVLNVSNQPMLPNTEMQDFEELMAFTYEGFADENLYIQYTKDGKDELYKIYAIGFFDYSYDHAQSIGDKKELKEYVEMVKKNSIYDYDVDVNDDDQIITVKTCTRYFGQDSKQQFQIDARKVREDEKIVNYKVNANKNFEKLNLSKENM